MRRAIQKADILIEALPYIKKFQNKVMVIKCGGIQLLNSKIIHNILQDIVFMNCVGLNPVLIHGGGPSINKKLRRQKQEIKFHHGLRVTDEATLKIVAGELGRLNKAMVKKISQLGAKAQGLIGRSGRVIKAERIKLGRDIGFVGEIASIYPGAIKKLLSRNYIPIIAPLGVGANGQIYNINADLAAAYIAAELGAWKLVLLTDVQGIMYDQNDMGSLMSTLKASAVNGLIKRQVISRGMLPKVNACIIALKKGVKKTHIIDGSVSRSLLIEIFTDKGIGTQIIK